MALTYSQMLPLGTTAPDFTLLDVVSNQQKTLQELKSPTGTVIFFTCNHCPYVKHILNRLVEVIHTYQKKGFSFIAICSNDIANYPDDSPEKMAALAQSHHFQFPYLFDSTQAIAKAYHATCTPDFFIFDGTLKCVYRGRFDDASPGKPNVLVTGKDLTTALDALFRQQPISEEQFPSMGCNIKWKAV